MPFSLQRKYLWVILAMFLVIVNQVVLFLAPHKPFLVEQQLKHPSLKSKQECNSAMPQAYPIALPEPDPNFTCASWIPPHQRRIYYTFHGRRQATHTSWKDYQKGKGPLAGEWYWLAGLEYVLAKLDFELVQSTDYAAIIALRQGRAHRYIRWSPISAKPTPTALRQFGPSIANELGVTCRLRLFAWWNDPENDPSNFWFDPNYPLNPYQVLNPLDDNAYPNTTYALPGTIYNRSVWGNLWTRDLPAVRPVPNSTGIPLLVHGQVALPPVTQAARKKCGYLHNKRCYFDPHLASVVALLKAGFELHTSCPTDPSHADRVQLQQLLEDHGYHSKATMVHHGFLSPRKFLPLLRNMGFVVTLGGSIDAPTPLEGLAQGAAYLNPLNNGYTQHRTLVHLKPPYVYNYRVIDHNQTQTAHNLVRAAEWAHQNRFASFVPPQHDVQTVMQKVCRELIESNQTCNEQASRHRTTTTATNLQQRLLDKLLHLIGTTSFLDSIVFSSNNTG